MFNPPSGVTVRVICRVEDGPGTWGSRSHGESVDPSDWPAVETAIRRLDGKKYNEISVLRCPQPPGDEPVNCSSIYLGGGEDNRVSVQHMENDAEDYLASEPARGESPEIRTYGGQSTELPAKWWISKDVACQAVRHFIETGSRDETLTWDLDTLSVR
jgi:hypothetical protein